MSQHRDIYAEVTQNVLEALDRGTVPWRLPWRETGLQRNLQSDRPYRGVNQLLLQLVRDLRGYDTPFWTTYRATAKAGGHVRKGERGAMVIFWRFLEREDRDRPGETVRIPMGRAYTVFNLSQTDGLEAPEIAQPSEVEPLDRCELIVQGMPERPSISHGGGSAFYNPESDEVRVPSMTSFESAEPYYSVLFHELTHSTAAEHRLARDVGDHRFGSPDYSREELVAEFGTAMLCGVSGIAPATLDTSAAYIDNWCAGIAKDDRLVVSAAGAAQRAADFILGINPEKTA